MKRERQAIVILRILLSTFDQEMMLVRQAIVMLSLSFLVLLALYEVGFGSPVVWWLYAAVTVAFIPAIGIALELHLPRRTVVVPLVGISFAWVLFLVPWNSRKPFLNDLYRIRPGMNEAQVRKIMGQYMEGTGWPAVYGEDGPGERSLTGLGSGGSDSPTEPDDQLVIQNPVVFRHSDDGAYNADWGIVKFEGGHVVSVDFSRD